MSGKFVALLLVLACVAQGYEAHVSSFAETRTIIDDIVKLLNDFIAKIRDALANIGQLIKDLENKIKDIIDTIDIPGLLADIKKQIDDIIKEANVDINTAAACLSDEAKAVEKLVVSTTEGVNDCLKEIDPVSNQIVDNIAEINTEAAKLIASITGSIAKCFSDNILNPVKLLNCLKGLVDPTEVKVNAFLDKVKSEIKESQKLIDDATTKLSSCIDKVGETAKGQEKVIIEIFQKCVNDIVN